MRIYLDVDGVLNAVSKLLPDWGWSEASLRREEINSYVITWSTELVAALNAAFAGHEVVWLTTWEDHAATMIAPALGLTGGDQWLVLHEATYPGGNYGWWKLDAIVHHLPQGQPAVWLDDDLVRYPLTQQWLASKANRVQWIAPHLDTGLTEAHLAQLGEWLA